MHRRPIEDDEDGVAAVSTAVASLVHDDGLPTLPGTSPVPASPLPTLTFDWREFEEYLAGSNLTEDQMREMLEALWYITVAFVDLGFGTTAVQQALLAGTTYAVSADKIASSSVEPSALASGFRAATDGVTARAAAKRKTNLNPPTKRRRHADQ